MARYQQHFELDVADIEVIEQALRSQIARLSVKTAGHLQTAHERESIQKLNRVLGKLHNQKIFYSQVNAHGVPAG